MTTKKQSLFRQKMKQKKIEAPLCSQQVVQGQQIQTFPKVFRLQQSLIKNSQNIKLQSAKQSQIQTKSDDLDSIKYISMSSYLQKNKQKIQKLISQQQLDKINQQNWNTIDSMDQQQRANYLNLIQNTLPKHFIQKLKKKQVHLQQKQFQNLNLNQNFNLQKQSPQKQHQTHGKNIKYNIIQNNLESNKSYSLAKSNEQIKSSHRNLQQNILNSNSQQHKKQQTNQDEQNIQSQVKIMQKIQLNITTQKLIYVSQSFSLTLNQQQKNNLVNLNQIYQFIKSENNQSQIIGSKLLLLWSKNIFPTQNSVFFVINIPFLIRIAQYQIYKLMLAIWRNIITTKFHSCYIELIVKIVEILTLTYKELSNDQLNEQLQLIRNQFQKSQKLLKKSLSNINSSQNEKDLNQRKQNQILFQSLGILYEQMKAQSQKSRLQFQQQKQISVKIINIESFLQQILNSSDKINDMVEAILLQQTLRIQQFQTYGIHPTINKILEIAGSYWDFKILNKNKEKQFFKNLNYFFSIFYTLVCKFNKKKRLFLFYKGLIKIIYQNLFNLLQTVYLQSSVLFLTDGVSNGQNQQILNLKSIVLYKILFIYRQLTQGTQKLATYLENNQQKWQLNQSELSAVIYVNFNHYLHVSDLKNQQIQTIQKMLKWINRNIINSKNLSGPKRVDSQECLMSLISLFLSSDQQIYSLIDQNLLFQLFKNIIQLYEAQNLGKQCQKNPILNQNQIKKLIQNYNFNSFGNDIFTKVIFWIAYSFSQQYEALIGEEIMMRYPMLFYYASEPIKQMQSTTGQIKRNNNLNPLLGNKISQIIQKLQNQTLKRRQILLNFQFPLLSNKGIKQNILKLLRLNLDFSKDISANKIIQKIVSQDQIQNTKSFAIKKSTLNTSNYLYRYLTQPFLSL